MKVKRKFHVRTLRKGQQELRDGGKPEVPVGRVPRISRLMALAIKFEEMIRSGAVKDQAELARLGHVSRARLSQIVNLLNLAPDIQEAILSLPPMMARRDSVGERDVRPIATVADWAKQRKMWAAVASH